MIQKNKKLLPCGKCVNSWINYDGIDDIGCFCEDIDCDVPEQKELTKKQKVFITIVVFFFAWAIIPMLACAKRRAEFKKKYKRTIYKVGPFTFNKYEER